MNPFTRAKMLVEAQDKVTKEGIELIKLMRTMHDMILLIQENQVELMKEVQRIQKHLKMTTNTIHVDVVRHDDIKEATQ